MYCLLYLLSHFKTMERMVQQLANKTLIGLGPYTSVIRCSYGTLRGPGIFLQHSSYSPPPLFIMSYNTTNRSLKGGRASARGSWWSWWTPTLPSTWRPPASNISSILGQSCLCPGWSAVVANLLESRAAIPPQVG